jgi:hypothetical protein
VTTARRGKKTRGNRLQHALGEDDCSDVSQEVQHHGGNKPTGHRKQLSAHRDGLTLVLRPSGCVATPGATV